jgi:hypothetical protein
MTQIIKVAQLYLVKLIAAELIAMMLVINAIQNAIDQMKNPTQTILSVFICVFVSTANAQNLDQCTSLKSELKLQTRSQLLSYVCEAKKSIHISEESLVNMQINISAKKQNGKLNHENTFLQLKALSDAKEVCVLSATNAFSELSKYGIKDGSVYDSIDYCVK